MSISPVGLYHSTITPPVQGRHPSARQSSSREFGSVLEGVLAAGGKPVADDPPVSDGVAQQRLSQFMQRLKNVLANAGVQDIENLTLSGDGRGGIIVDGDHPERTKIEKALREHPELAQEFNLVARDHQPLDDLSTFESSFAPRRLTLAIQSGQVHIDYL